MAVLTPLQGILFLKALIDVAAGLGWLVSGDARQALMFAGFAMADLACLLMAPR